MDLISLFLFPHENNEIKSPTKFYDFTVFNICLNILDADTRGIAI